MGIARSHRIECRNCGYVGEVLEGHTGLTPIKHFIERAEYSYPGFASKDERDKQINEWKKKNNEDSRKRIKKEEYLDEYRKKHKIETFKCPKCKKDTLVWY